MIIAVHGFNYDPSDPQNAPFDLFQRWQVMLGQPVRGFPWYSGRLTMRGEERALAAGYVDQYAYAYKGLAPDAGDRLYTAIIAGTRGPVDGIGHSLGSRPWLSALATLPPGYVRRLLILNGAELREHVPTHLPTGVEILNVCVKGDLVLKELGCRFAGSPAGACIGLGGVTGAGWREITLDDPATQKLVLEKRGWNLQGVPLDRLDLDPVDTHLFSYLWEGNQPLYRAWLAGDALTDIIPT